MSDFEVDQTDKLRTLGEKPTGLSLVVRGNLLLLSMQKLALAPLQASPLGLIVFTNASRLRG